MTRLVYTKTGNLLYTEWFTVGPNSIVRGEINTSTYTYSVVQFDRTTVDTEFCTNLRQAKSKLKTSLTLSGVNFSDEIRNTK